MKTARLSLSLRAAMLTTLALTFVSFAQAQCTVTANTSSTTVPCGGGFVDLTANGNGGTTFALNNDFNNGGAGTGWNVSPAGQFNNPCGPSLDGTTYMWMGNTTAAPRTLQSAGLDVSCGGQICFDLKFSIQGGAAPCEGPDLTNEGVYLQYSIDGGATFVDINYFQPNTATNAYTTWQNYCFTIPAAAQTGSTIFQWYQGGSSGTCCDHWGIDNVTITAQSCISYYYDWDNIAGSPDNQNQAGVFVGSDTTFNVIYTNGVNDSCTAAVTITVLGMGAPTVASTDETCDGDNDGTITVTPNGGVGPYTYTVNGPGGPYTNGTGTFTGLPDGNYTVDVTDVGSSCTGTGNATVAVGANCCPSPITYTPLITNLLCNGDGTGALDITPADGDGGPYNISIDNGATFQNGVMDFNFTGLAAGTYDVYITDASGCVGTGTETITEPLPLTINFSTFDVSCHGQCDGSAIVIPGGGTTNYSYSWNGGASTTTATYNNLCAGNYDLTVTDANGCSIDTLQWPINTPAPFAVTTASTQSNCGQADGSASVTNVTGNSGTYTYLWDAAAANQTTATASNLMAGSYNVTITDAVGGCDTTVSVTVMNMVSNFMVTTSSINANCNQADGSASIDNVTGGNGGYTYLWNAAAGNQVTAQATNLAPGTYSVVITDAMTCDTTVQVTVPNVNSAFTIASSSVNSNCNNPDGIASIDNVIGGGGAYTYLWDAAAGNQTTAQATGLVPGSYDVTITDAYTCDTTITVTVGNNPGNVAQLVGTTDALCNGAADGTAEVSSINGTAPYTFQWDAAAANQTTALATGLAAGNYTCVITDQNGCLDQITVTVGEPTPVVVSSNSDTTICENGSATITGTGSGGIGPYTYQWNDPAMSTTQTITVNPTNTTIYDVVATDANGCVSPGTVVVVDLLPPLSVTALTDQGICPGDQASISAIAQGGDGNYTYTWDQGAGVGQLQTVAPLGTTPYTVTVNDGCETTPASDMITITVNDIPTVLFSGDILSGCMPVTTVFTNDTDPNMVGTNCLWDFGDGTVSTDCNAPAHTFEAPGCYDITLTVTSPEGCIGTATQTQMVCVHPFPEANFDFGPQPTTITDTEISFTNLTTGATSYSWNFDNLGTSSSDGPVFEFPTEEPGSYLVCLEAVSDQGCEDTVCKTVVIDGEFLLYVPNAFTPDEDGVNDFFQVQGRGIDEGKFDFLIFNRWGELVFEAHSPDIPWDGTFKGQKVKQDLYVWKVVTRDVYSGESKEFTGHVTVLR